MEYQCTFVRYERREGRVVPIRVTKAWVEPPEQRAAPGKQKVLGGTATKLARRFTTVRVTELRRFPNGDVEQGPEEWESFTRQESRGRLLGLCVKYSLPEGGEPLLTPVGGDTPTLAIGTGPLTWAQANAPLDAEPESREWYLRQQWAESRGFDDELEAA